MNMLKSLMNNKIRNIDTALLLLRIFGGGMMLTHGYPKLKKVLSGDFGFGDPVGLGPEISLVLTTFAEFFCAIAIIIGFKSRLASIPLMFAMLVAALIHHGDDPFRRQEFPLLYFVIYLAIFLMGSGSIGVDGRTSK